jgi:hypothetical protein
MGLTENLVIGTAAIIGVYVTYDKYFSRNAVKKRRLRRKNRDQYVISEGKLSNILGDSTQALTQEMQQLAQYFESVRQQYKGKAPEEEINMHLRGKLKEALGKVEVTICKKHGITDTQVLMALMKFEENENIQNCTDQIKALIKMLKLEEVSKSDLPDVCQTIDTFINITTEMMGTLVQKMKLLDEEMNPGKNRMFYQNQVNVQAFQARLLNTQKSVSKELCQKYGLTEKEYQDAENYYSSNRCAPEEQRIFRETIKQLQMQMQQTQQQIGLGM